LRVRLSEFDRGIQEQLVSTNDDINRALGRLDLYDQAIKLNADEISGLSR